MGNERFTVHIGDNLPILKTLADNSVDAIVTDPPYGLNDGTETLQDVFFAKFFNVFFPQFNKLVSGLLNQSQFALPPERISLLDLMNRAIDIHSRVGVPEGSVNFNDCIVGWNEKIKDAYESPFTVPHGMLSNEIDLQLGEEAFDFTLQLRRCFNATLGDSATIGITECGFGRLGVLIVIHPQSRFASFLRSNLPSQSSSLTDIVGLLTDPARLSKSASKVVTSRGTELRAILTLDSTSGTCELIPAGATCQVDAVFELVPTQNVRALTGTSGLASVFQALRVSEVKDVTARAFTLNIHQFIVPYLNKKAKGFMGKRWDYDVPSVELWAECLRVLKPGGHLLAFAGTRTQHRMAVRIEDAGFEIRDMIAWVYGSGFPKSLDVSKAIDKAAGAEREVVGVQTRYNEPSGIVSAGRDERTLIERKLTTPATDAAKQWDGWGTALKPSFETVTFATKPLDTMGYCAIMIANLTERIESCRHNAKNAVKSLGRSQADLLGGKINTAHASVATGTGEVPANETATGPEDATHLKAGTSASTLEAEDIALNTFLSWRRILEGVSSAAKTSTILTAFETTIDWKILSYCLLRVTPNIITQAKCNPNGLNASALRAVTYLNASLASCESILALFAVAPAMSQEAEACRGEDVKPNLDPCILARKPLAERTVAANVLEWGTGGVNVDGCRIATDDAPKVRNNTKKDEYFSGKKPIPQIPFANGGRFPANLIHDGSDEVVRLFPVTTSGKDRNPAKTSSSGFTGNGIRTAEVNYGDTGSAARFFYAAKASRSEREAGLEVTQEWLDALELVWHNDTVSNLSEVLLWEEAGQNQNTDWSGAVSRAKGIFEATTAQQAGSDSHMLLNGNCATGLFLKAIRCITSTKTRLTIESKTLNSLAHLSINGNTEAVIKTAMEIGLSPAESAALKSLLKAIITSGLAVFPHGVNPAAKKTPQSINAKDALMQRLTANIHSTVKPIALMRYLCRLVTPPGGIVLDPFTGSGTTGCAAMLEGFRFIGLEREEQYVEIAQKRIEYWRQVAEHTPSSAEQAQMTLLDMQDE